MTVLKDTEFRPILFLRKFSNHHSIDRSTIKCSRNQVLPGAAQEQDRLCERGKWAWISGKHQGKVGKPVSKGLFWRGSLYCGQRGRFPFTQIFVFQRSDSKSVCKNLLMFKYWQLKGKISCRRMLWSQKNLLAECGWWLPAGGLWTSNHSFKWGVSKLWLVGQSQPH